MAAPLNPFEQALIDEGVVGTPLEQLARKTRGFESGGNPNAVSNRGARGGMQVMPATFSGIADPGWNIDDDYHNSRAGIRYLKQGWEKSGGDPALTGAFYYGGPGGLEKAKKGIAVSDPMNPNFPNTLQYGQRLANAVNGQNNQVGNMNPNSFDFDRMYQSTLNSLAPMRPSEEAVRMFAQNNQQRAANLPLAMAAMISRDKGMNNAGQEMYADAVLAGRPMAMGDAGWVSPDGQFIESPDAAVRQREHALRITLGQMEKFRQQQNSDRMYDLGVANYLATVKRENRADENDGPTPSQGLTGRSPIPTTNFPNTMQRMTPPAPSQGPAPSAPQVVPQVAPQISPTQTKVQPQASATSMTAEGSDTATTTVRSPTPTPDDVTLIDSIGKGKRVGRSANGAGDIYEAPNGGRYVLDPATQKYYTMPEGVSVVPDEKTLEQSTIKEMASTAMTVDKLQKLRQDFKKEYGGKPLIGQLQNTIGAMTGNGYADQANWWAQYREYFNKIIHDFAGSAQTASELKNLERVNVYPGMAPDEIERRLEQIHSAAARGYDLLKNSLGGSGYVTNGLPDVPKPQAAPNTSGVTIKRRSQ